MKLKTLVIQRRRIMKTIKFREYVEHKRKGSPNFMNYEPEFNGNINEIFNGNLQSAGTKITYMQYTGVNDKNGKEIYEGDIIRWKDLMKTHGEPIATDVVEWADNEVCYITGMRYLKYTAKHGEVIGNKFENPELLEKTIEPKMKFFRFRKPFRSLIAATSEEKALQIYKDENDEVDDNDDVICDEVRRVRNLFFEEKALLFPYLAADNSEIKQALCDQAVSRERVLIDEDDFKYMEKLFWTDDLDNMED